MRAQVGLRIAGRLSCQRRMADRRRLRALQPHRHGEPRDPDIGAAFEPFVVADVAVALVAPAAAPGILDPEAAVVVSDDGEGVVTEFLLLPPGDAAVRGRLDPAFVYAAGGIQHAHFGERGVHRDQVLVVDTKIRAERTSRGIAGARVGIRLERPFPAGRVGPGLLGADAVVMPALHRAAATRSGIALAAPFVVAPCHVVEHARADARAIGAGDARAQQGMRDGRQAEGGAGALVALVEDRHAEAGVVRQRPRGRHVDQRRLEHAVAEVGGIGAGVEQALVAGECRWRPVRCLGGGGHGVAPVVSSAVACAVRAIALSLPVRARSARYDAAHG